MKIVVLVIKKLWAFRVGPPGCLTSSLYFLLWLALVHVFLYACTIGMYERNNRWAFYSALLRGIDKLWLVALWDGKMEPCKDLDAYLVQHMVQLMRENGAQVEHINSSKLPSNFPAANDAISEPLAESVITKKKTVSKRKS